ncbi:unnamed protein product [Dibothriocephalus latus]|uniref:Uncharacterized protein n=1 Tax=Dibothriocephalus latus TaxID=60516 RepID=A0A3P7LGX7_DIBLA|nr:unnamed protein product [Dibothriocephalus latus]
MYSKRKELRSVGEWAFVTGAAAGIGLAFCKELAKEGLKILMVDMNGPKLKSPAKEVEEAFGVETRTPKLDLSNVENVGEIRDTINALSSVACFVNNAFDNRCFMANLDFMPCMRAALPKLSEAAYLRRPFLITITSIDVCLNHPNAIFTRVPLSNPFVPSADVFAAAALDMLGVEEINCGYFFDALQFWFSDLSRMLFRSSGGVLLVTAPSLATTVALVITIEFSPFPHNMGWLWRTVGLAAASPLIYITAVVVSATLKYTVGKWLFSKRKQLRSAGEWAVVTGAAAGIGLAFCKELAKEGLKILMVDVNGPKLMSAATEVEEASGVETRTLELDLSKIVDVNVRGFTCATRAALPKLCETAHLRRPFIINMSSISAVLRFPGFSVYAASKSYVKTLTDCLQVDLRGSGVRLQTYIPCLISTKMTKVPPSRPFVPTADIFAAAALDMLGVEQNGCGYFYHDVQYRIFRFYLLIFGVRGSARQKKSQYKRKD